MLESHVLFNEIPAEALDCLVSLHGDERAANERSLAHCIFEVIAKSGEQDHSLLISSACTGDPQSHGSALADIRVITFSEMCDHAGEFLRSLEKKKADISDGGSAHIRVDIRHSHVEELAKCLVIITPSISHAHYIHRSEAQDGVLRRV